MTTTLKHDPEMIRHIPDYIIPDAASLLNSLRYERARGL